MLHSEAEVHKNSGDKINRTKQLIIAQLMTMILLQDSDQQHSVSTSRRTPIIISTPAGCLAEPDTPPTTGVGFKSVEYVVPMITQVSDAVRTSFWNYISVISPPH